LKIENGAASLVELQGPDRVFEPSFEKLFPVMHSRRARAAGATLPASESGDQAASATG
jgi:hypothetical protein